MGSLASEAAEAVDVLRERGIQAGVVALRIFRPFPSRMLADSVAAAKTLVVLEKAISYGYEGALATELKASLYSHASYRPQIYNYIMGLGGRDVRPLDLLEAAQDALEMTELKRSMEQPRWLGSGV
jgi:pyruvate/2-oxoacid:ferredoxin oxidoreductase alpha subunit